MIYVRGEEKINVPKGAYKSIFKGMGFIPEEFTEKHFKEISPEVHNDLNENEYENLDDNNKLEITEMVENQDGNGENEEKEITPVFVRGLTVLELKAKAKELGFEGYANLNKDELISLLESDKEDK